MKFYYCQFRRCIILFMVNIALGTLSLCYTNNNYFCPQQYIAMFRKPVQVNLYVLLGSSACRADGVLIKGKLLIVERELGGRLREENCRQAGRQQTLQMQSGYLLENRRDFCKILPLYVSGSRNFVTKCSKPATTEHRNVDTCDLEGTYARCGLYLCKSLLCLVQPTAAATTQFYPSRLRYRCLQTDNSEKARVRSYLSILIKSQDILHSRVIYFDYE